MDPKLKGQWQKMMKAVKAGKNSFNEVKSVYGTIHASQKQLTATQKDNDGNTLLSLYSKQGCLPAVEFLVRMGGDPNSCNNQGNTSLHLACQKGHKEVIAHLIDSAGNPFCCNTNMQTCVALIKNDDLRKEVMKMAEKQEKDNEMWLLQVDGEQRAFYRVLFDTLDKDQDGLVSMGDIDAIFRSLGLEHSVAAANMEALKQEKEEKEKKEKKAKKGKGKKKKKTKDGEADDDEKDKKGKTPKGKKGKGKKGKGKKGKGKKGADLIPSLALPEPVDIETFYDWWDTDNDGFLTFNDFLRLVLRFQVVVDTSVVHMNLFNTPRALAKEHIESESKARIEKFGPNLKDDSVLFQSSLPFKSSSTTIGRGIGVKESDVVLAGNAGVLTSDAAFQPPSIHRGNSIASDIGAGMQFQPSSLTRGMSISSDIGAGLSLDRTLSSMSKISDSDTESTYTAKAGGGSSSINIITLPSVPDQGEEGGEAGIGIDGSGQAMVDAEGGPTHEHSERGGTIRHNYSPRAR